MDGESESKQVIPAHMFVLSISSPVFEAMFHNVKQIQVGRDAQEYRVMCASTKSLKRSNGRTCLAVYSFVIGVRSLNSCVSTSEASLQSCLPSRRATSIESRKAARVSTCTRTKKRRISFAIMKNAQQVIVHITLGRNHAFTKLATCVTLRNFYNDGNLKTHSLLRQSRQSYCRYNNHRIETIIKRRWVWATGR
ncbi:hypothetical protein pdam_00005094 [Pocillopora damicornis]|uniref:BTB domain-containing protein n=1 Tax=Pocillopora damicornis TaxID=46731 RepID=A0A3M6TNC0_POCDA|nr:hypothetical protein pdam_00005094 [Pocillopora damicornis]